MGKLCRIVGWLSVQSVLSVQMATEMTALVYNKNKLNSNPKMKTNLIGRAYLAKIASDTQKKASECSRFSNEANEIGAETQQDNESTMRRIARMLGCDFLYPWKSIPSKRNEPSAFRQMMDCKMRQPKTEKSYFFPE